MATKCDPCPPCETPLPVTCEPLLLSETIDRLVGEDADACKVTLRNPLTSGILFLDGSGAISWKTGATGSEINLSALRTSVSPHDYLVTLDSNSLAKTAPTFVAAEKWYLIGQSGGMTWVEQKNIFGSGSGILRKDINSPYEFSWLTGNAGQIATIGTDGNVTFKDVSIVVPANAFRDLAGLTCVYVGTKQININFSSLIVTNSGGLSLGITNASAKSVTLTTTGANGLDTGSLTTSENYYLFIIYNATSGTIATLASLNGVNPILPSGYTYFRRVGMFRTNSSSNVPAAYFQNGQRVIFGSDASIILFTQVAGGAGNTTGTVTQYISTDYAKHAIFRLALLGSTAAGEFVAVISNTSGLSVASTATFFGGSCLTAASAGKSFRSVFSVSMPLGVTSYYYAYWTALGASDSASLILDGYELNL
jgi:hypothetical protein